VSLIGAIETSSAVSSVALIAGDGSIEERAHDAPRGHVEFCVPALIDLLGQRGLRALDAIAVGIGPGAFTGLRVGVQTAKTLAVTLGVPLVAISSLEVLAVSELRPGRVLACLDAFRGEVFAALFERTGDGSLRRLSEDAAMPPEDAVALAAGARIIGTGPARFPDAFGPGGAPPAYPSAADVARLARGRLDEAVDALTLEPRYLRRSEAEIRWGDTGVVAARPDRIRFRTVSR
jgi:tRNA threonylcarbamoyladenosine biosynthesis protein TsaB